MFFTFVRNYGGTAILICLVLEYIGLPLPGESLMLMLGFLCQGIGGAFSSIIMATIGTFTGSMIAYTIGYRYGERVVLKIGKPFHITKENLDKTDALVRKHEALYIIFCRFIPGARHIVPYLSGMSHVNVLKNAFYNLISAVIWCTSFILLGSVTGSKWTLIGKAVGTYTIVALVLIIFVFIVYKYFNEYKLPVLVFSVSIIALMHFTSELMENELVSFDSRIYDYLATSINKNLTDTMKFISNLGSIYVLAAVAAVLLVAFFIKRKYWFYGKMAALNLVFVSLLNILFKSIIRRARPVVLQLVPASGYSFPSGHSMVSAAFYGYLIYLCVRFVKNPWKQVISAVMLALIFMIGVSRVYLGVHFASDVICGFLAGLSWLVMFISLTDAFHKKLKTDSIFSKIKKQKNP